MNFSKVRIPEHLLIKGRLNLSTVEFRDDDKLYRSYTAQDLDENGNLCRDTIRFPDLSCNWSKFSEPSDIKYRRNASENCGCYSFTVLVSRYMNFATPVHDLIEEDDYENYAHVEVRELYEGEDIYSVPKKGRKKNQSRAAKDIRQKYRQNIVENLTFETEITL